MSAAATEGAVVWRSQAQSAVALAEVGRDRPSRTLSWPGPFAVIAAQRRPGHGPPGAVSRPGAAGATPKDRPSPRRPPSPTDRLGLQSDRLSPPYSVGKSRPAPNMSCRRSAQGGRGPRHHGGDRLVLQRYFVAWASRPCVPRASRPWKNSVCRAKMALRLTGRMPVPR